MLAVIIIIIVIIIYLHNLFWEKDFCADQVYYYLSPHSADHLLFSCVILPTLSLNILNLQNANHDNTYIIGFN